MSEYLSLNTSMPQIRGLIHLMRPKQWVKNVFVLAPLAFASLFLVPEAIKDALLAAGFFCIASSIVYIINDMQDVERDRRHPRKAKTRPLAAGIVSLKAARILLVALCAILTLSWFIIPKVMAVFAGYIALNLAYTFSLKKQPVVDIFSIAIGFVLRVYAGAVAINVFLSGWMFITTLCLALYLAAVKRRQELIQNDADSREVLKKYSAALIDRYAEMSATAALLFYSMFVMSTKPDLLITVPLVLFGLYRYWFVVEELDQGESPTDALFADWQLLIVVLLWIAICCWSLWPHPH